MNSLDALEIKKYDGIPDQDRYFIWLCYINNSMPIGLRLSDYELKIFSYFMYKKIIPDKKRIQKLINGKGYAKKK